jgi:hypothetical protein
MMQLRTEVCVSFDVKTGLRKASYLPSIAQWHHVVNIHVAGSGPSRSIVGAEPPTTSACACRVGHYTGTVALEDLFTGVAGSGLSDPVGEKVARVAILWSLGSDGQAGKLSAGFAG